MLGLLSKLSVKLKPFRKLTHLLSVIFISVIIYQLFGVPSNQVHLNSPYAMLSFIACIWLLLINLLISMFANIPTANTRGIGMIARFKIKALRIFYRLLALLFITLTLVIIFLSVRLLRI